MCTCPAADTLCVCDTCTAHNVMATELVHVVKEVFQERPHRLVTNKNLGLVHNMEGLVVKCGDNTSSLCRRKPAARGQKHNKRHMANGWHTLKSLPNKFQTTNWAVQCLETLYSVDWCECLAQNATGDKASRRVHRPVLRPQQAACFAGTALLDR